MRRLNSRVEAEVLPYPGRSDYLKATVAVNRRLAWPFDISKDDWNEMDERERHAYLERSAITLIGRYGDAREVRIREDGQIVAKSGEAEV